MKQFITHFGFPAMVIMLATAPAMATLTLDFESYSVGTLAGDGWSASPYPTLGLGVVKDDGTGNNVITGAGSTGTTSLAFQSRIGDSPYDTATKSMTADFIMTVQNAHGAQVLGWKDQNNNGFMDQASELGIQFGIKGTSTTAAPKFYIRNGLNGTVITGATTAAVNTWYRMTLTLDTVNNKATLSAIDLSTNTAVNTGLVDKTVVMGIDPTTYDGVAIYAQYNTAYIDNIVVPEPATMVLLAIGAGLSLLKRRS